MIAIVVGVITSCAYLIGIATHWLYVRLQTRRVLRRNAWYLSEIERLTKSPDTTLMDWALLLMRTQNLRRFLEGPADEDGDADAVGTC